MFFFFFFFPPDPFTLPFLVLTSFTTLLVINPRTTSLPPLLLSFPCCRCIFFSSFLRIHVVDPATVPKAVIKERPTSKKSVVYAIRSSLLEISEYPIFSVSFFPPPWHHFSPLLVPLRPTCSSLSSTPRSSSPSSFLLTSTRRTPANPSFFLHSAWRPPKAHRSTRKSRTRGRRVRRGIWGMGIRSWGRASFLA
ncbi:hypothetical protein B0H19DRAFT_1194538 [Mycena capillaripes]|nr:hypothetical protein B0H19DRAFT_1194538 [Mycena capillaripes]